MIASDRSSLFANGVIVAGRKCTVLRDALNVDGQNTMDIKMKTSEKEPDPFSFTIGRSHKGERVTYMSCVCSLCCLINAACSVNHQCTVVVIQNGVMVMIKKSRGITVMNRHFYFFNM